MSGHRGSGRGPTTVACASHMDAKEAAQAVALRRDRLIARQQVPYAWHAGRQAEIDMLGDVWRLYRAFNDAQRAEADAHKEHIDAALYTDRHRPRRSDIGA